jgi:Zn-dependent protease with chaperone function
MESFSANYNDGLSARRYDVTVRLGPRGLDIEGEGLRAHWPYDHITALDEEFTGAPLRIALKDAESRLTCRRADLPRVLFELAPRLAAGKRRPWRTAFISLAGALAAVLALAVVLLEGVPAVARWSTVLVPVSWEVALGEGALEQVVDLLTLMGDGEGEVQVCQAPEGRAAVENLSGRLQAAVGIPYDIKIYVLDHPMVNAFALPGGSILVMRGLIEFAQSPDELAGVLAHEMGHVAARHSLQKLMEQLGIGIFFGVFLGDIGTGTIAVAGETLLLLSYSRGLESEADDLGLARLAAAGLDPRGLADLFVRLEEKSGETSDWMRLLSTHPLDAARVAKFAAAPAGDSSLSPEAWRALRDICKVREKLSKAD